MRNEVRKVGEELWILHPDSEVFYASRVGFVVVLIEAVGFYINNSTKISAFRRSRFYSFGNQLLRKLHDLFNGLNESLKPIFTGFVGEKFVNVPGEGKSTKQLYLNSMRSV